MARAIQRNLREPKNDPTLKIKSAAQALGPFKGVFYGRNKQGKTDLATASELRTLLIDCNEKGFETARDRPNVSVYELENWAEEQDLYWWAKAGKHDIELFVIDTISMLATVCMKHVLGEMSKDTGTDPSMPTRQHYGKVNTLMTNMMINWRNLPYNVIFLAQERRWVEEDEDGEEGTTVEVTPSLSKGPLQTLLSCVGTIGRVYTREAEVKGKTVMEHRLLLGAHPKYMSGTRIKGLPRVMRLPDNGTGLQRILDKRNRAGELPPGEAAHGLDLE